MPDRPDPAIPATATDYPEEIPEFTTTSTDSQAQSQVYAGYAPSDALSGFMGAGAPPADPAQDGWSAFDAYGDPYPIAQPRYVGPLGGIVLAHGGLILGYNFIDVATLAGTGTFRVILHDGTDASGPIIALAVNTASPNLNTGKPIRLRWGLFVEVVGGGTGVVNGVIYTQEDRSN